MKKQSNRKKYWLDNGGKMIGIGTAGMLLCSCSWFNQEPESTVPTGENRFDFLRHEENISAPAERETMEQELVKAKLDEGDELSDERFKLLTGAAKTENTPARGDDSERFYEDFILTNADEELPVSLVFNSAPLLDVLPAFADVLGFNFLADSDLKNVVTLNLNSTMTRRELWDTFDKMLYLSGAGVMVDVDGLLRVMPLSKLAMQPDARMAHNGNGEVYYYALKNTTAKDVLNQLKPFLGRDSVVVELTQPNAILLSDDRNNMPKIKQLLEIIDQSRRGNWPCAIIKCRNVLPSKLTEELQSVLPVLGFSVVRTTDTTNGNVDDTSGAILLAGIDRLQIVVASAATEEAIREIRDWVEILDSSDSIDQERIFVYKVAHNKATQLTEALSVIFDTQGSTLTVDTSGDDRTSQVNSNYNSRAGSSSDTDTNLKTDRNSNVFDTPVKVFADGVLNRLVVRTTPRAYASVKALLDRLDVVPAQVLLQVLVVEVTLNKSTEFGLEFSYADDGGNAGTLLGTNYSSLNPYGDTPDDGFRFLINDPDDPEKKFGYIKALAGNNALKVISSPQLVVSSHTEAQISVGSQVPVISSAITNTSSEGSLIQNYNYQDTGIILTITPEITSTDLIALEVVQTLSTAMTNTISKSIDSPIIQERTLQTSMTIANGRTMILGGLIQEQKSDDLETIPIIGDIPILNRLFGNTSSSTERTEILVMITGYVVDEKSPVEDMIKRYNDAIKALNEFENTMGDRLEAATIKDPVQ